MPIRPENKGRYPADWPAIRARILDRAGNCCEGTHQHPGCRAENGQPHPRTGSRVVLTIAHFPDSRPENVADDNLRALCQACHLSLDLPIHLANRRRTLARRLAREQNPLFAGEEMD